MGSTIAFSVWTFNVTLIVLVITVGVKAATWNPSTDDTSQRRTFRCKPPKDITPDKHVPTSSPGQAKKETTEVTPSKKLETTTKETFTTGNDAVTTNDGLTSTKTSDPVTTTSDPTTTRDITTTSDPSTSDPSTSSDPTTTSDPSTSSDPTTTTRVCPTDWSLWGSGCYYASIVTKMSWGEAQTACHDMAAQLVKIESPEENDFIVSETTVLSGHFWIGLNDLANEGTWIWQDGTPHGSYSNWDGTTSDENKDCVRIKHDNGRWSDQDCTKDHGLICEN